MERSTPDYRRKVIILIILFLVLRLVTASLLELGNDEAYYWLYSQDLRWNYFDHPPMVAAWVRLSTLNGWLDNYEVMVRAGSIIGCAFSTWFLYRAVSLIHSERAGWFTACLFNASLYAGLVAGVLIMPDSPQLFFWSFCLWQIAKLIHNDKKWLTWILFGVAAGLCIMSKVHGVFIWLGLGLFTLLKKREWLIRPQLYVSLLLSILITSPIFIWNLQHDFLTWRFHSARVTIDQVDTGKDSFLIELIQQVIVNNPFNIILIIAAFLCIRKQKLHPALVAYNCIALPLAIVLIVISFFRDIWFHWSGPAYTTLLPLAAIHLAQVNTRKIFPSWLKWSTGFFAAILIAWPMFIHYYPGTYGSKDEKTLGLGDVTLDKYGWKESGESFSAMYRQQVDAGHVSRRTPIICPTWWGAHIEYYFARPADAPVIGLGDVQTLHHYAWLNAERIDSVDMDTAFSIITSIEDTAAYGPLNSYYRQQQLITTIPVHRNGKPVSNFYVHMLTGWRGRTDHLAAIYAQQ
jgi:4-amino-4-deoxy-L-arabinose transferase-like glycosyltransferase